MKIHEFEKAVWDREGVRIVIRAPDTEQVEDYEYQRSADEGQRITEWLENRVNPKIDEHSVTVVDGSGSIPNGNNHLNTVRSSYTQN